MQHTALSIQSAFVSIRRFEGQFLSRKLGWCPMKTQWVARWLGGAEGPPDWQEMVGKGKRWQATSTPLQSYDPQPLPSVPGTPQVGRDFYLDEPCTARGFVSVTPTSLAWKDRADEFDIKLTQGVATSVHAQYSWTVPSGAWTHRRALFRGLGACQVIPQGPVAAGAAGESRSPFP